MILKPHRTIPVLIAGAGPAGLVTAITLARAGVECLLVERRRDRSTHPRATVVSTRSMELMRAWGLEQEVLGGGVDVEWLLWTCETLARAGAGTGHEVGYPSREQSALISPTAPACVPQDQLEPVVLRHFLSLAPSHYRDGTAIAGVEPFEGGVQAILRDAETGDAQVVHARHLVAADGAHSTVRRWLGIAMRGPDRLAEGVSALFHAPLWDLVGDRRYGLYVTEQADGAGVFLPAGRGDRWLYAAHAEQVPGGLDALTPATLAQRIEAGAGAAVRPRVERFGRVVFAAQLADRFRCGDVFLVGDAAHRVSPRGGTGMNTAIRDGHDLGWKLAWTLKGWAGDELLDSYEAERRPVAEHNRARSADPEGSLRAPGRELHVDLGGRIPHVWTADGRSTLDLLGPGLTLLTRAPETWEAAAAARSREPAPPLTVGPLDPIAATALGIDGDGALLVRPDGRPVALLPPGEGQDPAYSLTTSTTQVMPNRSATIP